MAAQETRIVTKFLRDRPDDSWTFDARSRTTARTTRCEKALAMDARRRSSRR